jgi:hypothetical protein
MIGVSRPDGVPGRTLTVEAFQLKVVPGERTAEATLKVSLRSSQGVRHTITLPQGAELPSVSLNGRAEPVRPDGRVLTLPLGPGSHNAQIVWRTAFRHFTEPPYGGAWRRQRERHGADRRPLGPLGSIHGRPCTWPGSIVLGSAGGVASYRGRAGPYRANAPWRHAMGVAKRGLEPSAGMAIAWRSRLVVCVGCARAPAQAVRNQDDTI